MIDNGGIRCEPAPCCGLCGTAGNLLYEGLSDHLFGAPGIWAIRQCRNAACAVGWVDPKPIAEDIGKLYQTYYTHEAGERVWGSHHGGRSAGLRALLARFMPWQSEQFASGFLYLEDTPPGRLLETGCGSGGFLAEAARRGWAAEGIDFDEKAVAVASARPGVTAWVGDIDDARLVDGSYDAILFNHVIEHVPNPAHVFARCFALLRPGGRLVMVTPNMQAQGRDIFGPDWRGLEIPRHLTLFTTAALRRLARDANFSRIQSFSPLSNRETGFIIAQSSEIARRAGRTPRHPDARTMRRTAALKSLLARHRGEYIALVAER